MKFLCCFVIHSFKLSGLLFIASVFCFFILVCLNKKKKMSEDILLYINIINFCYLCMLLLLFQFSYKILYFLQQQTATNQPTIIKEKKKILKR